MKIITEKYGQAEGVSISCIANGNKDQILSILDYIKKESNNKVMRL